MSSEYDEIAADVMAAEAPSRAEEKAFEIRLDMEDEARRAEQLDDELDDDAFDADGCCIAELIDGRYEGCGTCPACQDQERDEIESALY